MDEIKIRRAEPEDAPALHAIYQCPKVIAGTQQLPYPSQEQWRKRLANPEEGRYNLVALAGERVVGLVSIQTFPEKPRRKHAGKLGLVVHDDWQGRGIGKALLQAAIELADNWLNLLRLELEVYTDNTPAIQLYERFGFEREGTLKRHGFRAGKYVDSFIMARLRPPTGEII